MEAVKGADAFQKAALPIVIVCSILTVAMGAMLFPLPSFSTDLTAFSPESDADDAESRMMAHFPAESRPMFIHIEGKSGENVLSLEALQEQNRVLQSILNESERGGDYIDSSITAPGILDLALDEAGSAMDLSEIDDWTTFFDEVLEENTTCGQAADDERALAAAAFIEAAIISNDADLLGVCDWLSEDRQGALSEPTASSTLWVLMIDPSLDDGERQGFQHWIRVQLDANTAEGGNALTYRSTSIDLVSHDINRGTLGELAQLVFGAVIVVVLLLAVAFRSLRGVAFPMVGLTSALVWTYGGLAAAGIHFSVLEVAVAPVVLGLGIDYSIHLQRRYDAFRAEGLEAAAAWLRGFETLRMALGLAVITTIGWLILDGSTEWAFSAGVAVLIIACPCALGLATPTALLVGTGRGARLGILIRGPEVLEVTQRVDTLVLDKTGTVTTGTMSVVEVRAAPGHSRDEVLRLAATVEAASNHPIARAITASCPEIPRDVTSVVEQPGRGVEGIWEGRRIAVARAAEEVVSDWGRRDVTVVEVSVDGSSVGWIALADGVKPTSAAAIAAAERSSSPISVRVRLYSGCSQI